MALHKKGLFAFIAISVLLLVTACGIGKGSKEQAVQDVLADTGFIPLSEGLEQFPIWFMTDNAPDRHSSIYEFYLFNDQKVETYDLEASLDFEEIVDMSDKELIDYVQTNGEKNSDLSGAYNVDIILDDLGNEAGGIYIVLRDSFDVVVELEGVPTYQTIFDTTFSGISQDEFDALYTRVDGPSVQFEFDDPDTNKKNVTVEETMKQRELEKERREEERANEQQSESVVSPGEEIYKNNCASCHGADLAGGIGPPLGIIGDKLTKDEIIDIIHHGTGSMPPQNLNEEDTQIIAEWLSQLF